ncbi:MAG: hypothetical protein V7K79_14655 [Nostoc sp.]
MDTTLLELFKLNRYTQFKAFCRSLNNLSAIALKIDGQLLALGGERSTLHRLAICTD